MKQYVTGQQGCLLRFQTARSVCGSSSRTKNHKRSKKKSANDDVQATLPASFGGTLSLKRGMEQPLQSQKLSRKLKRLLLLKEAPRHQDVVEKKQ